MLRHRSSPSRPRGVAVRTRLRKLFGFAGSDTHSMSELSSVLLLETPSRLHFGLLSFGRGDQRQFGGVGLMIRRPGLRLEASPADEFETAGLMAERTCEFARLWQAHYGNRDLPRCRLQVLDAPRQHTGLGVGTQLGLGVAVLLHACGGEPCPPPAQLALSVRRGLRSAIGAYGFCEGGMIVERGKLPHEVLSPLDARIHLPDTWRVVLIFPGAGTARLRDGLSGTSEYRAFATLPAVPPETTRAMTRELRQHLVPAAASGDFERFAESVYRYGRRAGECFAPVQEGAYHSPLVESLVRELRREGVRGVGQSSWGPTLFALQPDQRRAEALAMWLQARWGMEPSQWLITRPCNQGARLARIHQAAMSDPHPVGRT
jgi:beta-ribofuranosylaminobenzene 5'-phosphate synthase